MKKVIFICFVSFTSFAAHAQLKNTKWKGEIQLESKVPVMFEYRNDTLEVINTADNSSIETMTYTAREGILTLQKVSGQSDCNTSEPAKYKFVINNDTLTLTLVIDPCDDRFNVLDNSQWTKIK
jgi:hypothetical protein